MIKIYYEPVGLNEVVLLVQIDQMNHTECDSYARFVLTPDFLKNYQGILFYTFSHGTRYMTLITMVHSAHKCTLAVGGKFSLDIYVQIYI